MQAVDNKHHHRMHAGSLAENPANFMRNRAEIGVNRMSHAGWEEKPVLPGPDYSPCTRFFARSCSSTGTVFSSRSITVSGVIP